MQALFQQDTWLGLKTLCFVALSILIIVVESHYDPDAHLRAVLSRAASPLQYVVDAPFAFAGWVSGAMTSKETLQKENKRLAANQLVLQARLQRFAMLKKDNDQLRALMKRTTHLKSQLLVARLLAVHSGLLKQEVVIDVGRHEGVFVGQPVLDAYGVMGQVVEVNPKRSRVLLVSDTKSGIPVQNTRSDYRAIALGGGFSNAMRLLYVDHAADYKAGDLLVTSGLGGRFPVGYPLAVVTEVKDVPHQPFKTVLAKPMAHMDRSREVVLLSQLPGDAAKAISKPTLGVASGHGGQG